MGRHFNLHKSETFYSKNDTHTHTQPKTLSQSEADSIHSLINNNMRNAVKQKLTQSYRKISIKTRLKQNG